MASFDVAELRRLSEAAPGDTWQADTAPWFGLRWGVLRAHDDGKALLSCNENTPNQDEHVAKLVAYLGTHREAILRMLEAADALAEAGRKLRDGVESIAMYGEESAYSPRELVDEYDAATKGTT